MIKQYNVFKMHTIMSLLILTVVKRYFWRWLEPSMTMSPLWSWVESPPKIFHALLTLSCEHSFSPFRSHNPMIIKSYHIKVIALAHISNPPKRKSHSYLVIESESECFLFIGSRNRRRVTWTMLVLSSRVLVLRQMRSSNIWQILTNIHWENIFKYQQ